MFGKQEEKETRFELVLEEFLGTGNFVNILRDKHTGVHYMSNVNGGGTGGLTPLLDEVGKLIIKK